MKQTWLLALLALLLISGAWFLPVPNNRFDYRYQVAALTEAQLQTRNELMVELVSLLQRLLNLLLVQRGGGSSFSQSGTVLRHEPPPLAPASVVGPDFQKMVYNAEAGSGYTDASMANRANILHDNGVDVLQISDIDFTKDLLSNPAHQQTRQALVRNGQKILASLLGTSAGVLESNITAEQTTLTFDSMNQYAFSALAPYRYTNPNYKTMWLDGECIQFTDLPFDPPNLPTKPNGRDVYVTVVPNVVRGCEGTTPKPHAMGSIPLNKEFLSSLIDFYNAPENINLIQGYYAMDDAPAVWQTVDYRGLQKMIHDVIRSKDPDVQARPIVYAQMAYAPDLWWLAGGTTDYTNVDAIIVYVYPWRPHGDMLSDVDRIFHLVQSYFLAAGKTPRIYYTVQTFGDNVFYRVPTKTEVMTEINKSFDLSAKGVAFYDYPGLDDNPQLMQAVHDFNGQPFNLSGL